VGVGRVRVGGCMRVWVWVGVGACVWVRVGGCGCVNVGVQGVRCCCLLAGALRAPP
jgi:hypothetical protein